MSLTIPGFFSVTNRNQFVSKALNKPYCTSNGFFVTKKNDSVPNGVYSKHNGVFVTKRNEFVAKRHENNGVFVTTKGINKVYGKSSDVFSKFEGFFRKFGSYMVGKRNGFVGKGVNEEEEVVVEEEEEEESRGESTMPDRFRYFTKEAPDTPVTWPFFIAVGFLLYAWRTVLWELSNWKKVTSTLVYCLGYLSKLFLALIFHFIGDPIVSLIRSFETMLYVIRAFYSSVINYTPIPEVTMLIILVSTVLAIAEASVPDSVESQLYLLTLAGIIGYAAVKGFISELFFWTLLFGLFSFARFVKKKDYVSSALPVAAVLAGMGEPWVRFVAMTSFLALAITQRAKNVIKDGVDEDDGKGRKLPVPLLIAGLAIGVRVAAKWAGYRHLTWMVV